MPFFSQILARVRDASPRLVLLIAIDGRIAVAEETQPTPNNRNPTGDLQSCNAAL
jgi:hypothetical protein